MNSTWCGVVSRCFTLGVLIWIVPGLAMAIGPNYQVVTDAGNAATYTGAPTGTLNDVVSLTGGGIIGTGTVIGISAPVNNIETVSILTANHVASGGVTQANFGFGGNVLTMNLTGKSATYVLNDANNPGHLPEDMTIVQATVNTAALMGNGNAAKELALINANPLTLSAFAAAPPASTAHGAALNTNTAAVSATQYGYGGQAQYNAAANNYTAGATGSRLFENNATHVTNGASDSLFAAYFEPITQFTAKAPSIAAGPPQTSDGQGTGARGDSGGPLMTSAAGGNVTVTPNWGPAAQQVPTQVPLNFTNSEAAVYVGVQLATDGSGNLIVPDTTNVGWENYAVPLVSSTDTSINPFGGSLQWARYYATNPSAVPEPSSAILLCLSGGSLLATGWRRRRALRAQIVS
jgi:hypothetical protein